MPIFHQPHNSVGNHAYNVYIYCGVSWDSHFHKNYEIVYVIEGEVVCSIGGKTKTLSAGDFAFCLPNEIHALQSVDKAKMWIGVFSEDFIREFKKYHAGKSGVDFSFRCPDVLLCYLKENLIKEELSDVLRTKSCLYALCSEYLEQIPLRENRGKQTALVGEILKYIEEHYKERISLAGLAAALGYEYCYFSKTFRRLFSMSFSDYINMYRFNEACAMLNETELPVTEISYESGFQSIRSFNELFKKMAGTSPSVYRKGKQSMTKT